MAKRGEHDFAVNALRVVEKAIGEHIDGTQLTDPNESKNPVAVRRGRLGGKKGGRARAIKLSSTTRKAIARKAAQSRWKKG